MACSLATAPLSALYFPETILLHGVLNYWHCRL
jgi:hypothetical protein